VPGKLAAAPGEKAAMIRARSCKLPVRRCCELVGVSRALVYHKGKEPKTHPLANEMRRVSDEHLAYGYRRIARQMQKEGHRITEKQTRLQMRKMGIQRPIKRRKAQTTFSIEVCQNNTAKGFSPTKMNELWVADITYVPVGKRRFAYFAVVLDAFSRRALGYCLSRTLHSDLCLFALQKALDERRPEPGWLHHSDRGSQYASRAYCQMVRNSGGISSFSGAGKPRDNALAESFFRTLKAEEVFMNEYETFEAAEQALGRFIDEYNRQRLHSSLGYETPADFETLKAEERQTVSV
jgi:putative transposase